MKVTMQGDREMRVERVFEAPRARVWEAMTRAELLAQWWGRGNRVTVEKLDVQRGGHWRFVEHTEHGDFGFEGRFREVRRPEFLSQTFEYDGAPGHVVVNETTLHDLGDGRTRIVVVSLFMTAGDRDAMARSGMEEGMAQSYAALDALLAR